MLIATDDALKSAVKSNALYSTSEVDNKFRKVIDLLGDFSEDFLSKGPTSDPNFGGAVTGELAGEVEMGDKSKSPMTILQALKNNLHSNVKFLSVSLSLTAD